MDHDTSQEPKFRYPPPKKRRIDTNAGEMDRLEAYAASLPEIPNSELLLPKTELKLIALRSSTKGNRFDDARATNLNSCLRITNVVEEALRNYPETDFLTLGEHTLYYHPHMAEAIKFGMGEDGKVGIISGQQEVVAAINRTQELARIYQTNICLGTVCEEVDLIHHNTAVIINKEGEIVQLRRKTTGSESVKVTVDPSSSDYEKSIKSAADTITPVTLTKRDGEEFKALVCVCAERYDEKFYEQAAGSEADLLVLVVDEGDDLYTERSRSRLEEGYLSNVNVSGRWKGDIFLDIAKRLRVITPNAVVLVADSAEGGQAGVFNAGRRDAIEETRFEDDCVSANCCV